MSWIRLEDNYSVHRKTAKFARLMGNPLAEAYLTRLWTWASACQPDGNLAGMDDADIADCVRFPGDPAILGDALRQSGFLDPSGMIHDWDHYQGAVVDKRNRDRARAAEERAKRKIDPPVRAESRDGSATVAGSSRDGSATVAGPSRPTVRYGTVRDDTKNEEHSSDESDQPALFAPKENAPPKADGKRDRESEVTRVLTHWRSIHATPASAIEGKAAEKRRSRVRARLNEGTTADECILALDGALKDPWLMGTDPKSTKAYRDVDAILRDRPQVEKLIGLVLTVARPAPNAPAASRGALDAHPIRYAEPAPLPGWTVETEIAACEAFSRDDRVRKFMVPRGEKLPDGFDVTTIPERFRPIRFQDEVKS